MKIGRGALIGDIHVLSQTDVIMKLASNWLTSGFTLLKALVMGAK